MIAPRQVLLSPNNRRPRQVLPASSGRLSALRRSSARSTPAGPGAGRRCSADKTWRGAIVVTLGPLLATLVLWQWPWWHDTIPDAARDAGPLLIGLLVGLSVVIGGLPNSLLKRQLDVAPGPCQRGGAAGVALTVLDQGDLVLGIWICLSVFGAAAAGRRARVRARQRRAPAHQRHELESARARRRSSHDNDENPGIARALALLIGSAG